MGSPLDYQTGTDALTACMKTIIDGMVTTGGIPEFAKGMAENFVVKMAPLGAKAVIDAVDAERAKGAT